MTFLSCKKLVPGHSHPAWQMWSKFPWHPTTSRSSFIDHSRASKIPKESNKRGAPYSWNRTAKRAVGWHLKESCTSLRVQKQLFLAHGLKVMWKYLFEAQDPLGESSAGFLVLRIGWSFSYHIRDPLQRMKNTMCKADKKTHVSLMGWKHKCEVLLIKTADFFFCGNSFATSL